MEDRVDKMVELLLSGARMMRYHCPKCKSPLFERGNKIICPVCGTFDKGQVRIEAEEEVKLRDVKSKEETASKNIKTKRSKMAGEEVIQKKREELLTRLNEEKDPDQIVHLLEAIEKINETLGID
ncbi:MAG: Sjogren's syndrome/scleroderma autoantigen 1 family protein [Candidatus Hydrothermarchaeales archaeon]